HALLARLTRAIHDNRAARRRAHLNVVFRAVEVISHVPIVRWAAGRVLTMTDFMCIAAMLTIDRTANRAASHCPAHRRDVPASAPADLMAQNSTDDRAGNCAADVRLAALGNALPLHPTMLVLWTEHRVH